MDIIPDTLELRQKIAELMTETIKDNIAQQFARGEKIEFPHDHNYIEPHTVVSLPEQEELSKEELEDISKYYQKIVKQVGLDQLFTIHMIRRILEPDIFKSNPLNWIDYGFKYLD